MSVLHNFRIERIYGERVKKGHKEYHIKWVDYGDDEDTWESETDLIQDGHQKDLDAYKKAKNTAVSKKKAKNPSFRLQVRAADQVRTKDVVKKNKTKTTGRHTSRPYPSSTPRFRKKKKLDKKKPDKKKLDKKKPDVKKPDVKKHDKKNPRVDHLEKRLRLKERIRARMALGRKKNNRQRVKMKLTF